jgi:hypothetical protein
LPLGTVKKLGSIAGGSKSFAELASQDQYGAEKTPT